MQKIFLIAFFIGPLFMVLSCRSSKETDHQNRETIIEVSKNLPHDKEKSTPEQERPSSAPAYPGLIEYQQPDGSVISIYLKGDERIHWAETTDGYTILANHDGEYQYAMHDDEGRLVLSGIKVSPISSRTDRELIFLQKTPEKLFFSDEQIYEMQKKFD